MKYKTGGLLLLSAGHWIELSNLNVDIRNLEYVAMKNYGSLNEYMEDIEAIKSTQNQQEKEFKIQKMANQFV